MLISTKGRYALRVMTDLAEHPSEGYVPLKEIAERQEISEKYLEAIIKILVKARLLNGLRGKGGGYKLTKDPEQYTVGSILRLTEDSLAPVTCLEAHADACPRAAECRTLPVWQGLDKVINDYLDHITLADLTHPDSAGNDYVI
ncbi:Rrf2 family transcriptional regulator [uncultured Dysosmobacter sp.]|uniref:RrF2 family transcriptional regulator n=1 Tax=uncultured Dysosmobacter sp. TaxID=2591384 RepID=UPI00261C653E|nr:RrF2 family transcriptional regulator [uncultured Dysosmobacter sp.]